MSDVVIRAEGLSKRYRIGGRAAYGTLRDRLADLARAPARALLRRGRPAGEQIWALRDVSFELRRGEVLGVIGRNGAGKSTLLKILSRITRPTTGRVGVRGRVGSLLEVGTGFHPELSGRENIYLNGAILGMRRAEIGRKFDEIVAFAEVERFIDTPVKHYSSGMYTRLAFAVAAHLEPEILVVDEVLAVGDAQFQRKCLGKMNDVAREGRTVLFVSHQMNAMRRLCERCLWLDGGRVRQIGPAQEVISAYDVPLLVRPGDEPGPGANPAQFLGWEIVSPRGDRPHKLAGVGPVRLRAILQVNRRLERADHGVALWSKENQLIWSWARRGLALDPGRHVLEYSLGGLPLQPDIYYWQLSLLEDGAALDNWYATPELTVEVTPAFSHESDEWRGLLDIPCRLSIDDRGEA